jgi:hypothetical protein
MAFYKGFPETPYTPNSICDHDEFFTIIAFPAISESAARFVPCGAKKFSGTFLLPKGRG